jgi:integrase
VAKVASRVYDEENVMSVRRRAYRDPETGAVATRWMVDVDIQLPNGERKRIRKVCPLQNKRAAEQCERDLRNELFRSVGSPATAQLTSVAAPEPSQSTQEVPTFAAFAKIFMATYAKANNKPSEQASKESILRHRLIPRFGQRRLDSFKVLDIDQLKADMLEENYNRKTINNAMAVWAKLLHYAQDQELIGKTPRFKFLKIREEKFDFFDFDELERMVAAAKAEPDRQAMILLGSEAGLRMGEMLALTQDCVDYRAGNLTIWENDWQGNVGSTKGGERRTVPMTPRLRAALQAIRHLRGDLVLCGPGGERWTKHMIRAALRTICKRAGLRIVGAHVLRHTFCSHLAMRGAAPKAIQELAGHKSLKVTLRYMHLTETALRDTMRLLEQRGDGGNQVPGGDAGDEVTAR